MSKLIVGIRGHLQEVKKYGGLLANYITLKCYETEETVDAKALRQRCEKAFSYVNMVLQGNERKVSPQSVDAECCEFHALLYFSPRQDYWRSVTMLKVYSVSINSGPLVLL